MTAEYAIEARNVHKAFGDREVVRGVDLRIRAGEITLLLGPNGEGKTVLVCCLAGGLTPTEGQITILGDRIEDAPSRLSLLLQGALGLPELTARENLAFYSRLHPAVSTDLEALLDAFGLDDTGGILRDFSGGMARKVELAIALSADVPVYLLDEPGAELDPSAVTALHDVLLAKREAGGTVVMTSHSPLDAAIADRIVFLAGGRIVADDTPDRLLASVPPVLRVRGPIQRARDRISAFLVGDHVFGRGDELRGFLRSGCAPEDVEASIAEVAPECLVDLDDPSYSDVFEYYAAVASGTDGS